MRVLVIDDEQAGLDFVLRCLDDGHEVRWFCNKPTGRPLGREGEGFSGVQRIDDWKASMAWAKDGLILTTGNAKFIRDLDRYREHGFKIFAPTYRSAQLEINRDAGMKAMQAVGIEIPHYEQFDSLKAAEGFAHKADQAYVFKTLGSEEDKSLTYVSSDQADMVGWLRRQQARGLVLKGPCMLQEKIDMVAEFGVSGWCGPEGFLADKWQLCFEHKKLMPGDHGPATGEMGTVCQYVESDPIVEVALKPMELTLIKAGHRGDFAVNCGIDSKGKAWPFEFTCRLGWPAFFIQVASHKGDVAQWMRDLLDGQDTLRVDRRCAVGVVCAQPKFPYDLADAEEVEGNPIAGFEEVWSQVHPVQVMRGPGPAMEGGKVVERPIFQTAGEYVAVLTGLGKTVEAARERAYDAVDTVCFANMIVRNDIGCALEKQLPRLQKFGYAEAMAFS